MISSTGRSPLTAAPYAALAVFLGHLFPVYHGLQGGKGVATAAGVLFAIDWRIGLGTLATWFIIAAFLRYSSLAALVAAAFAPFFTALPGTVIGAVQSCGTRVWLSTQTG